MSRWKADPEAKIDLICPICGRKFWRWRSQAKWRGARYCSARCQNKGAVTRRSAPCRHCGETFTKPANVMNDPGRGKFCDRQCFLAWKREQERRVVVLTCVVCGVTFSMPAAWVRKGGGKCCSRKCAGIARHRGPTLPRRGSIWRRHAATIRDRDGDLCVRCGQPEQSSKSLNVDHILPARMFTNPVLADDPGNLASLCTACHAIKTHRYEPRILRGDFLALDEFYDRGARERALRLLGADRLSLA